MNQDTYSRLLEPALQQLQPLSSVPDRFIFGPGSEFVGDILSLNPVIGQLIIFAILLGGVYALAAIGLTLVFGVMDIVNFAHGAFIVLGMYLTWLVSQSMGFHPIAGILVAVLGLAVLGAVINELTIAPIVDAPQHNQFILTLGLLFIVEASIEIVFGPDPRTLGYDAGSIGLFGMSIQVSRLYALFLAILATGVLYWLLFHTKTGRAIRGVADDRESAKYVGINISRVDMLTFATGAALAGLAGAALTLYRPFDPSAGLILLITAFVIVVLGGLGSLRGAFVGAMVIGFVEVFGGFYLPGTSERILIFIVFIMVLVLKPEGLMGEAST